MDAIMELISKLSPHQKAEVIRTLSQLEEEKKITNDGVGDSPGHIV